MGFSKAFDHRNNGAFESKTNYATVSQVTWIDFKALDSRLLYAVDYSEAKEFNQWLGETFLSKIWNIFLYIPFKEEYL